MTTAETTGRTRRRGRRNADATTRTTIEQMPWQVPCFEDAPTGPLSPDGVQAIHNTALRILEEIGIDFLNEEAKSELKKLGCDVDPDGDRVRFDRDLVMREIAKAPSTMTLHSRNGDKDIVWGGKNFTFGQVSSPPNTMDLDKGRRPGNVEDYQNFLKLTQMFNCLHFVGGYPVEPVDIHASVRHLDATFDMLTLTDKVIYAYSLGTDRVEDTIEMARIATGLSQSEFDAKPRLFTNINSSSPLKHDWPMLDGAMRFARRNQPVIIAPFTLAGAMAPITIVGAVAQQIAECLAGIVLLQAVNPGCPVVMGAFTSNVDMKSGAPAFGTPEYVRAMQISGQMARFYGLPLRASNANAANAPDAQAMWESCFSLQGSTSAHANVIYHAAGWLEGGLSASFEKFIMDCEVLQQIIYYNQPVSVSEDDLAFDAIKEVGPEGHFFGCDHTQSRFKTAFYAPFMSDWRNYEAWEEAGSVQAPERANKIWKSMLAEYQPPEMDIAIKDELTEFVARRKSEGGIATDF